MLPEGYKKLDDWFLTFDRAMVWQVIGLVFVVIFTYLFQQIANFSLSLQGLKVIDINPGLVILLTLPVFIIHELIHGVGVKWAGGKPKYGVGLAYWVMPYFYCTTDAVVPRNKYIVLAALPSVVLTLIGAVLIFLFPQFSIFLVTAFAYNAAGGIGDAWLIKTVLRYPDHAYIKDEKHGLSVYGKENDKSLNFEKGKNTLGAFLGGFIGGSAYFILGSMLLTIILHMSQIQRFVVGLNGAISFTEFSTNLLSAFTTLYYFDLSDAVVFVPPAFIYFGLLFGALRVYSSSKKQA